jgi:hypothetical protein
MRSALDRVQESQVVFIVVNAAVQQRFSVGGDRGQRRPELVRDVRNEFLPDALQHFEFGDVYKGADHSIDMAAAGWVVG